MSGAFFCLDGAACSDVRVALVLVFGALPLLQLQKNGDLDHPP